MVAAAATGMTGAIAAPAIFSITPARHGAGFIDYGTKAGKELYYRATAALPGDKFDCTADGLQDFLRRLRFRANEMGWTETILSPHDPAVPTNRLKFLSNYGTYEMEDVRREAATYHPQSQTRQAQDSYQLFACLMASLTKTGRDKVTIQEGEYTIQGEEVGIMFLKLIISKSATDCQATAMSIRLQLSNLSSYIKEVSNDIPKFNHHVESLLEGLTARGESSNDLLVFLFQAYGKVKDAEFQRYLNQKRSDYEEGKSKQ